jgi:hypothetical protein
VCTIQQQAPAVRIRLVGQFAKRAPDRVLATDDGLHQGCRAGRMVAARPGAV